MKKLHVLMIAVLAVGVVFLPINFVWAWDILLKTPMGFGAGTTATNVYVENGLFNNDANLDLVVVNENDDQINILTGNGDGTFAGAVAYGVGDAPKAVVISDFNGDDEKDLAVVNSAGNNVSILIGNGDGTFDAAVNTDASTTPYSIVAADFNGDNIKDLAVANSGSNNVSILMGNGDAVGDGTFTAVFSINVGTTPYSIAFSDFNEDNIKDLAVANSGSNNVSILIGNGDLTFDAAVNVDAGTTPYSIAVSDFDGDVNKDLVVANNGSNNISILAGNGDGTFDAVVNYASNIQPRKVVVNDLDGDGNKDLLVANYSSASSEDEGILAILINDGAGAFEAAVYHSLGSSLKGVVSGNSEEALSGDFDGDSEEDAAVIYNNTVKIFFGVGDGTLEDVENVTLSGQGYGLAVVDLDGDGDKDMAAADYDNSRVSIFLADGIGGFAGAVNYDVGTNPSIVAQSDFDNDGDADLAVANEVGGISLLLNDGDGTFAAAVSYAIANEPVYLAAGDVDGDNIDDLVVADDNDLALVLLNNGSGVFANPVSYASGENPVSIDLADLNNDGRKDMITANTTGNNISIFLNIGNGVFGAGTNIAVSAAPYDAKAGDLNSDGNMDLVVSSNTDNEVSVLLGDGDGTFQDKVDYSAPSRTRQINIADINLDGKLDVLAGGGGLYFFAGVGDGTLSTVRSYAYNSNYYAMTADINGDNKIDAIVSVYIGVTYYAQIYDNIHSAPGIILTESGNTYAVEGSTTDTYTIKLRTEPTADVTITLTPTAQVSLSASTLTFTAANYNTAQTVTVTAVNDTAYEQDHSGRITHSTASEDANYNAFTVPAVTVFIADNDSAPVAAVSSSGGGGGLPPEAYLAPTAPAGGFLLSINDGLETTTSTSVSLGLVAGSDVVKMAISNFADMHDAGQEPYVAKKQWDLCSEAGGLIQKTCVNGSYTVYAKYFTAYGQSTDIVSATINYDDLNNKVVAPIISQIKTVSSPISTLVTSSGSPITAQTIWAAYAIVRELQLGSTGSDVLKLQKFLNKYGYTVASNGPGSPGNETSYFGVLTRAALIRFQDAFCINIFGVRTVPTGKIGRLDGMTKSFINVMLSR